MSASEMLEELDAQVDALVVAIVRHNQVIQDAEQAAIADPTGNDHWADIIDLHRKIVTAHVHEVELLRAEIQLLIPGQRHG